MLRIVAMALLLLAVSVAEAQTTKPSPVSPGGALVEAALSWQLCQFVAWGVPPEVRPGDPRLGKCPPRRTPRY